jgi:short-subunit dehydrogenase|tara:strand:- start:155 stop:991 length:837 start_codon:yes stop_codon:yes gene_type:complete
MKTKNILITGCSSGIGKNVAITLHNKGWRVFATCRSKTDCTFFTKLGIESFPLDLLKEESINCAVNLVKEKTKSQLDVLFNNGAYAIPGAIQDIPRSAMREIFEVNVFGQIDLINRCIPLMMSSDYPKIINCSSVLGFISLPYRGLYSATKYSIEALTDALRRENYDSKIKFVLIQPGPINTDIKKKSIKHFEKWIDWKKSIHQKTYENKVIKRLYDNNYKDSFNSYELQPDEVTKILINVLNSKKPKARYKITIQTKIAQIMIKLLPTNTLDWFFKI